MFFYLLPPQLAEAAPGGDIPVPPNRLCAARKPMCVQRLTPDRLHLVFPSLSICLFHFHAPRLMQIKLSFMFLSHSPWVGTWTRGHTHTHMHERANATVIRSGCQCRQRQQFYLLNVWKCNYFPPSGHVCVREAEPENLFAVLTVRWVSAGRWKHLQQCRKSGSCSDRWGKEKRRVGYITWARSMWTS